MFNSNLGDSSSAVDFEIKEQELRQLALQRQQELDQSLVAKDRKLREQDAIIRAQMDRIQELTLQGSDQERLISEYEGRFNLVKDAIADQSAKHQAELQSNQADLQEWQDRTSKLETKLGQMAHERSDLLSKIKDQQWSLDQELKRSQREVAGYLERTTLEKQNYLKDLDQIKKEIQDRHIQEISAKNQELLKSETLYTDRISNLEKSLSQLELQHLQHQQVEEDLRQKSTQLQSKNESLRLDLFQSGDSERKQSIQLQLQVNELKQDVEVREQFQQKQQSEWQIKLQNLAVQNERLQLELQQCQERLKHREMLGNENTELEVQKVRAGLERQLESMRDAVQELTSEKDGLRSKLHNLTAELKDQERTARKDLLFLQQKSQETEQNFHHGQREQRAQVQIKNKEILQQREEIDELQSKLNSSKQEIRHLMVQNQMIVQKYEDCLQELDKLQTSMLQVQSQGRREDEQVQQVERQLYQVRQENMTLRETVREQTLRNNQQQRLMSDQTVIKSTGQGQVVQTPRQDGTTGEATLIQVDDDQTLLINSNRSNEFARQQPNSTKAVVTFQPFSPITSESRDRHGQQTTESATIQYQTQMLQTKADELDSLKIRLAEVENDNRNLRLKLQAEWNQTQDLQKKLFTQNSHHQQTDRTSDTLKEDLLQKDLQLKQLQNQLFQAKDELIQAQKQIFDLEKYIVQLKNERDRVLDISQTLKAQLLNSEKKEEEWQASRELQSESKDNLQQEEVSLQISPIQQESRRQQQDQTPLMQQLPTKVPHLAYQGLNQDLKHLQPPQTNTVQDNYRYFPYMVQPQSSERVNHSKLQSPTSHTQTHDDSFAVVQQHQLDVQEPSRKMSNEMKNSLQEYARAQIQTQMEQYQPQQSIIKTKRNLAAEITQYYQDKISQILVQHQPVQKACLQTDLQQYAQNKIHAYLEQYQPVQKANVMYDLQQYAQSKISDIMEQQQLPRTGELQNSMQNHMQDKIQDILENFQPNMKMFDQSQLSGMTGMSVEQMQLRSKNFSPTSILKHSNAFSRENTVLMSQDQVVMTKPEGGEGPDSEGPQKKNMTFGEANKVTFSAQQDDISQEQDSSQYPKNVRWSDSDGLNNIKVQGQMKGLTQQQPTIKDSAKAAAQARLQQLKRTYTLAEGPSTMFPLRQDD